MTPRELAILTILNGRRRLPHLEEEIFNDFSLVRVYARELLPQHNLVGESMLSTLSYRLCTVALAYDERWYIAEPIIEINTALLYEDRFPTSKLYTNKKAKFQLIR